MKISNETQRGHALVTSLAAAIFASAAAAADTSTIAEVTVTAHSLEDTVPQELSRYGTRVETIDAQTIQRGGYNDVAQALQALAPGLYISPLSGAFDYVDLSFQGSRTGDVLWLVDGVRISNRLYHNTTPIDTIPAHAIERIEILEGGQGLFYGTQAVAGAVNIVTKDFSDKLDGAVGLGVDGNEGRHVNAYVRDTLGGNQFVVYGSIDKADGFKPFRDQDFQPSATDRERGYDVRTVGAKYAYRFNDAWRTSVSYQHTDADLDYAQPKLIAKATNKRDQDILSAKLDYTPSEIFQLFVKGYYHWWDAYFNEIDNDVSGPVVSSDHAFWGFKDRGINALTKIAAGHGLDYFVGYDYQRYSGQDDELLIARHTESVHAPFAQVRTTPELFKTVSLALGVRYNRMNEDNSATVWNLSGKWDITPNLFIRGTAGTAFRLPDAYELFAIDPCCEIGNPNLAPEKSKNVNFSIGGALSLVDGELSWEAIGFARDITDLIDIVFDDNLDVDTFDNLDDEVKVRGGEAVVKFALETGWSVKASYTYTRARASGSDLQIQDIPKTQGKLSVSYDPQQPFGASVTVNHVGDVYRNLGIGRQEFGNYAVVDLDARFYVDRDRHHRIGARLENALDKEYASRVRQTTPDDGGTPYAYWYLGTPRTWHVDYTLEF